MTEQNDAKAVTFRAGDKVQFKDTEEDQYFANTWINGHTPSKIYEIAENRYGMVRLREHGHLVFTRRFNRVEDARPEKGDRVRITCEGVFQGVNTQGHHRVCLDGATAISSFLPEELAAPTFKIEVLKPTFKVGDKVRLLERNDIVCEVVAPPRLSGTRAEVVVWSNRYETHYVYFADTLELVDE